MRLGEQAEIEVAENLTFAFVWVPSGLPMEREAPGKSWDEIP